MEKHTHQNYVARQGLSERWVKEWQDLISNQILQFNVELAVNTSKLWFQYVWQNTGTVLVLLIKQAVNHTTLVSWMSAYPPVTFGPIALHRAKVYSGECLPLHDYQSVGSWLLECSLVFQASLKHKHVDTGRAWYLFSHDLLSVLASMQHPCPWLLVNKSFIHGRVAASYPHPT